MENIEYEIYEIRQEQRENNRPFLVPNGEYFFEEDNK